VFISLVSCYVILNGHFMLVVFMFYCFNTFVSVLGQLYKCCCLTCPIHSSLSLLLYCVFLTNKDDDDDDDDDDVWGTFYPTTHSADVRWCTVWHSILHFDPARRITNHRVSDASTLRRTSISDTSNTHTHTHTHTHTAEMNSSLYQTAWCSQTVFEAFTTIKWHSVNNWLDPRYFQIA